MNPPDNPPDNPPGQLNIDSIEKSKPKELSPVADEKTENEREALERAYQQTVNEGAQQDIKERKKYAHRNFCLIVGWITVVNIILFFQGFNVTIRGHRFQLESSVLLMLIGTTTGSVVGIFLIVTNYLFPKR